MSRIRHCPNPECPNFHHPTGTWFVRIGSYHTAAHGTVRRVRCKSCGHTASTQTFSIHYFAKRRLPLESIFVRLRSGSSLRDIARTCHVSVSAVRSAVYRLGRQSMAAQSTLLDPYLSTAPVAFDGLQSYVTSQDFPCHITTAVDSASELVLDMTHTVLRRGGTMRPAQKQKRDAKELVWKPKSGSLTRDISLLVNEIPRFHRMPVPGKPLVLDTDEHPVYASVIGRDTALGFWKNHHLFVHRRTPVSAPRTTVNRLFPVNYIDRLLRHRMKEHTRETIAFGRHGVDQMHRAWIMAYDHNFVQPWRVRKGGDSETHAQKVGIEGGEIAKVRRVFFRDRIDMRGIELSPGMRLVWEGKIDGPPVRWNSGQKIPRPAPIPSYALREAGWRTQGV